MFTQKTAKHVNDFENNRLKLLFFIEKVNFFENCAYLKIQVNPISSRESLICRVFFNFPEWHEKILHKQSQST